MDYAQFSKNEVPIMTHLFFPSSTDGVSVLADQIWIHPFLPSSMDGVFVLANQIMTHLFLPSSTDGVSVLADQTVTNDCYSVQNIGLAEFFPHQSHYLADVGIRVQG
ncbi:hypothetical protein DPMN_105361 [Dreissena polymorpha]|uniref:Uncharacterized protein n=1 Tax=Dreissena polymorpha TaxID=45954 RepID=A0A9D4K291_DREPO|nr:hypothetical protein DPMN_105361 [Dreissena polymorpha]